MQRRDGYVERARLARRRSQIERCTNRTHNKSNDAPHDTSVSRCVCVALWSVNRGCVCSVYRHLSNSISCGSSVKILIRLHLFDDDCFPCSKCCPIIYLSKYGKTIFSLKMNYTLNENGPSVCDGCTAQPPNHSEHETALSIGLCLTFLAP